MTYQGFIKKCRTYDLAVLNKIIDMAAATILMYTPEQIGITVPIYLVIRMGLNSLSIWLRSVTTGPVGEK